VAFDLRVEPGIQFVHEWRQMTGAKYRTGPMLTVEKGRLSVPGRVLMELPPNEWAHLELSAALGENAPATWTLTVAVAGQAPQHFEGLKFIHADVKQFDWIGFVSAGQEAASYWLDELEIANTP
jgi:hypothetical protein